MPFELFCCAFCSTNYTNLTFLPRQFPDCTERKSDQLRPNECFDSFAVARVQLSNLLFTDKWQCCHISKTESCWQANISDRQKAWETTEMFVHINWHWTDSRLLFGHRPFPSWTGPVDSSGRLLQRFWNFVVSWIFPTSSLICQVCTVSSFFLQWQFKNIFKPKLLTPHGTAPPRALHSPTKTPEHRETESIKRKLDVNEKCL